MTDKELLENILAADVLIISKLIDAKKREGGTTRMGSDYTREAIEEIKKLRPEIVSRLIAGK